MKYSLSCNNVLTYPEQASDEMTELLAAELTELFLYKEKTVYLLQNATFTVRCHRNSKSLIALFISKLVQTITYS